MQRKANAKHIHTINVTKALAGYKPNMALDTQPPDILQIKKQLPVDTRSTLSQDRFVAKFYTAQSRLKNWRICNDVTLYQTKSNTYSTAYRIKHL